MNTTKIAPLYPYFLDACRHLHTGRSMQDMMSTVQQALLITAQAQANEPNRWVKLCDQDNPVQRFDELGLPTDEYLRELVPARVFEWVCRQMPAQTTSNEDLSDWRAQYEAHMAARTGWQVTANEVLPKLSGIPGQPVPTSENKGRYAVWAGNEQELAVVMRGLRALRAKRRKHTRRLLAQLWAYHLLQQRVQQQSEAVAEPVAVATSASLSIGLLPRLAGRLRRGLAAKIHQVAVAAEAAMGKGAQVA